MPEKKGLWQMIMRTPTRVICLLLMVIVALLLVHTIQFTPKTSVSVPEDFYITTPGGVTGWNSSAYDSDLYSYDAFGQSLLDVTKVAVVAGVIIGVIVLAWFIAFLPKKTPLWLFPAIGGVLALVFVMGLQLKPAGESATLIDWVAKKISDNPEGWNMIGNPYIPDDHGLWGSNEYRDMFHNRPYDMGYILFLYPVMYVASMIMGPDVTGYGWVALNNVVWLQYVNAILLAIAVYMILRTVARLFGKNAAQSAGLLSVVFLPLMMLPVALSAEIPALFFASIALERTVAYLRNETRLEDGSFVRSKRNGTFGALLSVLCMAVAVLLKTSYAVMAVVLTVLYLFDMLRRKRLLNIIPFAVVLALVIITLIGIYPAATLSNSFIFGVTAPPAFPDADLNGLGVNPAGDAMNQASNQATALSAGGSYALQNILYKQWNDPSFSLIGNIQAHLREPGGLYMADTTTLGILPLYLFGFEMTPSADGLQHWDGWLVSSVSNAAMNAVYLFAILGLLMCFFRANIERLSLPLYAVGGILFHMFFGLSPISSFPYFLALIGLAGYGLASLVGILHGSRRRDDPMSRRKKKSIYRKLPPVSKAARRADEGAIEAA